MPRRVHSDIWTKTRSTRSAEPRARNPRSRSKAGDDAHSTLSHSRFPGPRFLWWWRILGPEGVRGSIGSGLARARRALAPGQSVRADDLQRVRPARSVQ